MGARFGPNTVAAERLLDDLDHLDQGAVVALAAAGGGTVGTAADDRDVEARADLRARLREIAQRGHRLDAVRLIGEDVAAWASSASHWFPAGIGGTVDSTREIGPRLAAVPFVLDAAYAVVLEDLLTDDELDLLLGPWAEVAGSPFDDDEGADAGRSDSGDGRADSGDGRADEAGAEDDADPRLPDANLS